MQGRKFIVKLNEDQLLLIMGLLAEERTMQVAEADGAAADGEEQLFQVADERLQLIQLTNKSIRTCRVVNPDGRFTRMTPLMYRNLDRSMR